MWSDEALPCLCRFHQAKEKSGGLVIAIATAINIKGGGGRWEKLVYLVTEVEWRTDLTSTMVMTIMMAIWAFECLF